FDPQGKLLGKIRLPVQPANCTFGGPDRRTLFITARTHLYAVTLAVRGSR
ncbi:MAG TPA: SMP-30/gluconolactonase/LRE family protein, partial [Phycisphaerae bacterium]|nr:SMP-30/gluconolactonase/LRE family protein [Phycisphaerae bacterium]